MKTPELLAPAGNIEKLNTALHYGADAVYMGLSDFSLRAMADNFSITELKQAVESVHGQGKKLYVTINVFPHNRDIANINDHLCNLMEISPDALIISDPGVFEMASDIAPDIPIHVSTQANISNYSAARFWERMGAKRLILSRELSIDEIRDIRDKISLELECFVHGAICISYSGRCYISSFMSNRSGNHGKCANSCRWNFTLMEEKRPRDHYPVYENDRGTYVMSSRDLCMIEHLDRLADAGVNSFKIEGRMKGINYVAGVVKTYREAVDSLKKRPYKIQDRWLEELSMISSRGYTTGMFFGNQPDEGYNHDDEIICKRSHDLVGIVKSLNNGTALIALRNNLRTGDTIQFLSSSLEDKTLTVSQMHDKNGVAIDSGRNENLVVIPVLPGVRANDLIRRSHQHSPEKSAG